MMVAKLVKYYSFIIFLQNKLQINNSIKKEIQNPKLVTSHLGNCAYAPKTN